MKDDLKMRKRMLNLRIDKTANAGVLIRERNCNMNCIWCHHDYISHSNLWKNMISNDEIMKIINFIVDEGRIDFLKVRISGDGEPLLVVDELVELIKRIKSLSVENTIGITTNGVFLQKNIRKLQKAGLDSVNISLNSLDPHIFTYYSGSNKFDLVMDGLVSSLQSGIQTKLNVIFSRLNHREIDDYINLLKKFPNLIIKFFDLIVVDENTRRLYLPLSVLEEYLISLPFSSYQTEDVHVYKTFVLDNNAKLQLKISEENRCPVETCRFRKKCVEGCRRSIRIRSDGIVQFCGIRNDNSFSIKDFEKKGLELGALLEKYGKIINI